MNKVKKELIVVLGMLTVLSMSMIAQVENAVTGFAVTDIKSDAAEKLGIIFTGLSMASIFLFLIHSIHSSSIPTIRSRINDAHYFNAKGKRQKAINHYKQLLITYHQLPDNEKEGVYTHLIELHKSLERSN
jgi:hypothetical protein